MSAWLVLTDIYLDSGTLRISSGEVHVATTETVYEGKILAGSIIDRSIPTPSGIPQVGDGKLKAADTDNFLRSTLSHQTARGRRIIQTLVEEGASLASGNQIYAGLIEDVDFGPGYCEFSYRDAMSAALDEAIPSVIHRDNFPGLFEGTEAAFLPVIQGHNESRPENPQGVIPLPYIGFDMVNGDRYGVAMHPCSDVPSVFRAEPGEAVFTAVSGSEYSINTEVRTFIEYPGVDFECTFLDFLAEQPKGTQIRADVDGLFVRPLWNGLAEVADFEENRQPVNFFLNLLMLILPKLDGDTNDWDADSVQEVLDKQAVALPGDLPLLIDGAIVESMTARELLGRFLPSCQIDFCHNSLGKKRLAFLAPSDVAGHTFKEGHIIERNSFYEGLAKPTKNRTKYRFEVNYATGEWASQPLFDNVPDQNALGEGVFDSVGEPVLDSIGDVVRTPKYEDDVFDLWFVRDPLTAAFVTALRMQFLALGSYRQTWTMPLPEVYGPNSTGSPLLELAELCALTHSAGAEVGGYVAKEVKVVGLTLDLARMRITVRSILRVPQTIVPPVVTLFTFGVGESIMGDLDMRVLATGTEYP